MDDGGSFSYRIDHYTEKNLFFSEKIGKKWNHGKKVRSLIQERAEAWRERGGFHKEAVARPRKGLLKRLQHSLNPEGSGDKRKRQSPKKDEENIGEGGCTIPRRGDVPAKVPKRRSIFLRKKLSAGQKKKPRQGGKKSDPQGTLGKGSWGKGGGKKEEPHNSSGEGVVAKNRSYRKKGIKTYSKNPTE